MGRDLEPLNQQWLKRYVTALRNEKPGICLLWEQRVRELPEITGDKAVLQKVWEDSDALGNMCIWQLLLSF